MLYNNILIKFPDFWDETVGDKSELTEKKGLIKVLVPNYL